MQAQAEQSTLAPPERRIIERPRLLKQLEETDAKTILLIAPAGYGKTTLARQWAKGRSGVWWYTAGAGSSDLARLAVGLAESLDSLEPGFHVYAQELLRGLKRPTRQFGEIADAFAIALRDRGKSTGVIDDYHHIAEDATAEALIEELWRRVGFRLLVASRVRPQWAAARHEIYGDLIELGPGDLALTDDEALAVLGKSNRARATALAQARGWPALVGLAAITTGEKPAPSNAVSSTLFRFFAEELFHATSQALRDQLITLALLPSLDHPFVTQAFGIDAAQVVEQAIAYGFLTTTSSGAVELHPLIRQYLLSKLAGEEDSGDRIEDAIGLSVTHSAWDHAFELVRYLRSTRLLLELIEHAFKPLLRTGRIATLEQMGGFGREMMTDSSAVLDLIDAETAYRNGLFETAETIAESVSRRLGPSHPLASHAHWLAGQGAQLRFDHRSAEKHFALADAAARDVDDGRDAIWGLVLTSLYSESPNAGAAVQEVVRRQDNSPIDLVRAATAKLSYLRYTKGFASKPSVDDAIRALDRVKDPAVRTSFTNTYAYTMVLCAHYDEAFRFAKLEMEQVDAYQLEWARPHAQWALAAAHLGLREFGTSEGLIQRVEHAADEHRDGHLTLNAAVLRARLLLALQRASDASDALEVDSSLPVNSAMRAEFLSTRALVFAVLGDKEAAFELARAAIDLTSSVDACALAGCACAVSLVRQGSFGRTEFSKWAGLAPRLGVWDALVAAIRAEPLFLPNLLALPNLKEHVLGALRRSRDFELAERAGVALGRKPRLSNTPLTPREQEVFELVRQGLTNTEIARALFISTATAKVHVGHILKKLGARNRAEAVGRALSREGA